MGPVLNENCTVSRALKKGGTSNTCEKMVKNVELYRIFDRYAMYIVIVEWAYRELWSQAKIKFIRQMCYRTDDRSRNSDELLKGD